MRVLIIHAHHGRGRGYFKKALRWMLEAQKLGYDAIVLLIDEDGKAERLQELSQAQEDVSITILPRALGVAVRTFDAWMLADENTLGAVLGIKVNRQRQPEQISDPKSVFRGLQKQSAQRCEQSILYRDIMDRADLVLLARRCVNGFAPFAGRIRQLRSG